MPSMAYSIERRKLVYMAKLAQQAERYSDMIEPMKKVAKLDVELNSEERDLLSIGCKHAISARRASWTELLSIEQKEESKRNGSDVKPIEEYRKKVGSEITYICNDIFALLDEHLIPSTSTGESKVFYYKMKGDYYRYLAEIRTGDERKEVAEQSLKAYETATTTAEADLRPINPNRLGLALNFSVFYYEIMNLPQRAYRLAKYAFDEAVSELDNLSKESCEDDEAVSELDNLNKERYKDSITILQLLRDNIASWSLNLEDGDAEVCYSGILNRNSSFCDVDLSTQ